jgi:hypothetical protein
MPEFFQTHMGMKFYDITVPRIATALENIAAELKRANDRQDAQTKADQDAFIRKVRETDPFEADFPQKIPEELNKKP